MKMLLDFALVTLRSPSAAAQSILQRNWPREALWTAFLLSVVLNTCVYTVQQIVLPPLPDDLAMLRFPPGVYFIAVLLLQIGFIAMLGTAGRWLGGQAGLSAILAVITWLQMVQAGLNGAIVLMFLVMPSLAALMNIAVNILIFVILLQFVRVAHQFDSLWRAFGVVLMASIIMVFALLFIVGLIGPANLGMAENV
jgi:hypothetical protein